MATDAPTIPRLGIPLAPLRPRVVGEWLTTLRRDQWPDPPSGNGQAVMLVPGFLAGDTSLTRMAVWLQSGGYTLARSGITWNTQCMGSTVERLESRLERAAADSEGPVLLIGQSRGGSIGRALAALRPDLIGTLVTLGSPLLDQLAVSRRVWPSIVTVGALGTLGVPGMFGFGCLRGECCARTRDAIAGPFPADVRFLSFYSRSDEIVRWESCLDPAATHVEVDASHVGMGVARSVWSTLASELDS